MREPNSRFVYIALTRPSAEDIAWPILHELDRRHKLGLHFKQAKLEAVLPNGSTIKLYGADSAGWIYRLYGQKLRRVGIDEAAFFSIDIKPLIDDILEPAVSDLEGEIVLMSIPGQTPFGYYYDAYSGAQAGWSVHEWTALDNPWMKRQFQKKIDEIVENDPRAIGSPTFKRNYLGLWVYDSSDLAYTYVHSLCSIKGYDPQPGDAMVLGLDMGWHDATAFSLCCWNENDPNFYELYSEKQPKMLISDVAKRIKEFMDLYPDLTIVGDASKRQVFEELRQRYDVPVQAAEKTNKLDWMDLVNADFSSGSNKIVVGDKGTTPHIAEMAALGIKQNPSGRKQEQPGQPNDCCDAYLYAYRQSYHYRYAEPERLPKRGSQAYWAKYEEDVLEQLEQRYGDQDDTLWWER